MSLLNADNACTVRADMLEKYLREMYVSRMPDFQEYHSDNLRLNLMFGVWVTEMGQLFSSIYGPDNQIQRAHDMHNESDEDEEAYVPDEEAEEEDHVPRQKKERLPKKSA